MSKPSIRPFNNTTAVPPTPAFASHAFSNFHNHIAQIKQDYISIFCYETNTDSLAVKNARGLRSVFFDLDLKEVMAQDAAAVKKLRDHVMQHSREGDPLRGMSDAELVESFVYERQDEQGTIKLMRPFAEQAVALLDKWIGKPTKIVFSGNGAHFHYWLKDEEGWSPEAQDALSSVPNIAYNMTDYLSFRERLTLVVNSEATMFNGHLFDVNVANAGNAGNCREVGTVNTKRPRNTKRCQEVFADLCDPANRFSMAKESQLPNVGKASKKKAAATGTATAGAAPSGRGKSVSTPIDGSFLLLTDVVQGENGEPVGYMSAAQLHKYMRANNVNKLPVRMIGDMNNPKVPVNPNNPMDKTQLNAFVQVARGSTSGSVELHFFMLNMDGSKSYVQNNPLEFTQNANGKYDAKWVFDGVVLSLLRDDKGKVINCQQNIIEILKNAKEFKGQLYKDIRRERVMVRAPFAVRFGEPDTRKHLHAYVDMSEIVRTSMRAYISAFYFRGESIQKGEFELCLAVATDLAVCRRDFVMDHISNIAWDGVDRFGDAGGESWLTKIMHYPNTGANHDLYREYGITIMNTLMRNIQCGVNIDSDSQHCVVFTGPQGSGKTTISKILGLKERDGAALEFDINPYIKLDGISMASSDGQETARLIGGKFLVDASESLSQGKNISIAEIKKFVTEHTLTSRTLYTSEVRTIQKNIFVCSSTNMPKFLMDTTGERRFLVVDLENDLFFKNPALNRRTLDLAWLKQNIDQLYAQAYQRVVLGNNLPVSAAKVKGLGNVLVQSWNLNPQYNEKQEEHNRQFQLHSDLQVLVSEALNKLKSNKEYCVKLDTIVRVINGLAVSYGQPTMKPSQQQNRLPDLLRFEGWSQQRKNTGNFWVYEGAKDEPAEQAQPAQPAAQPAAKSAPEAAPEAATTAKSDNDFDFDDVFGAM